jgi:hypothetical protein
MTDTTRDLIERMAKELDFCHQCLLDDRSRTHPLAIEARAYLGKPELNAPTVEDLQAQIHALRADYLRMANAVANQLPYRTKFFADLIPNPS